MPSVQDDPDFKKLSPAEQKQVLQAIGTSAPSPAQSKQQAIQAFKNTPVKPQPVERPTEKLTSGKPVPSKLRSNTKDAVLLKKQYYGAVAGQMSKSVPYGKPDLSTMKNEAKQYAKGERNLVASNTETQKMLDSNKFMDNMQGHLAELTGREGLGGIAALGAAGAAGGGIAAAGMGVAGAMVIKQATDLIDRIKTEGFTSKTAADMVMMAAPFIPGAAGKGLKGLKDARAETVQPGVEAHPGATAHTVAAEQTPAPAGKPIAPGSEPTQKPGFVDKPEAVQPVPVPKVEAKPVEHGETPTENIKAPSKPEPETDKTAKYAGHNINIEKHGISEETSKFLDEVSKGIDPHAVPTADILEAAKKSGLTPDNITEKYNAASSSTERLGIEYQLRKMTKHEGDVYEIALRSGDAGRIAKSKAILEKIEKQGHSIIYESGRSLGMRSQPVIDTLSPHYAEEGDITTTGTPKPTVEAKPKAGIEKIVSDVVDKVSKKATGTSVTERQTAARQKRIAFPEDKAIAAKERMKENRLAQEDSGEAGGIPSSINFPKHKSDVVSYGGYIQETQRLTFDAWAEHMRKEVNPNLSEADLVEAWTDIRIDSIKNKVANKGTLSANETLINQMARKWGWEKTGEFLQKIHDPEGGNQILTKILNDEKLTAAESKQVGEAGLAVAKPKVVKDPNAPKPKKAIDVVNEAIKSVRDSMKEKKDPHEKDFHESKGSSYDSFKEEVLKDHPDYTEAELQILYRGKLTASTGGFKDAPLFIDHVIKTLGKKDALGFIMSLNETKGVNPIWEKLVNGDKLTQAEEDRFNHEFMIAQESHAYGAKKAAEGRAGEEKPTTPAIDAFNALKERIPKLHADIIRSYGKEQGRKFLEIIESNLRGDTGGKELSGPGLKTRNPQRSAEEKTNADDPSRHRILEKLLSGDPLAPEESRIIGEASWNAKETIRKENAAKAKADTAEVIKTASWEAMDKIKQAHEEYQKSPEMVTRRSLESQLSSALERKFPNKDAKAYLDAKKELATKFQDIEADLKKLDRNAPDYDSRVSDVYRKYMERNWPKHIVSMINMGHLTNPSTYAKVFASHAISLSVDDFKSLPTGIADSLLQRKTGSRTSVSAANKEFANLVYKSAVQGVREAAQILGHGEEKSIAAGKAQDLTHTVREIMFADVKSPSKAMNNYMEFIARTHAMVYRPHRVYAYNRALFDLAKVEYMNEKPQGVSVKDYTLAKMAVPTEEMAAEAALRSEMAVYLNENQLTKFMRAGRYAAPGLAPVVDWTMPFARVSSNIVGRTLEHVPGVASIKEAGTIGTEKLRGESFLKTVTGDWSPAKQKRFVDTFGKSVTGLGLVALGSMLKKEGKLTGWDEKDPERRGMITMPGGYTAKLNLGPYTNILILGATGTSVMGAQDKPKQLGLGMRGAASMESPFTGEQMYTSMIEQGRGADAAKMVAKGTLPAGLVHLYDDYLNPTDKHKDDLRHRVTTPMFDPFTLRGPEQQIKQDKPARPTNPNKHVKPKERFEHAIN